MKTVRSLALILAFIVTVLAAGCSAPSGTAEKTAPFLQTAPKANRISATKDAPAADGKQEIITAQAVDVTKLSGCWLRTPELGEPGSVTFGDTLANALEAEDEDALFAVIVYAADSDKLYTDHSVEDDSAILGEYRLGIRDLRSEADDHFYAESAESSEEHLILFPNEKSEARFSKLSESEAAHPECPVCRDICQRADALWRGVRDRLYDDDAADESDTVQYRQRKALHKSVMTDCLGAYGISLEDFGDFRLVTPTQAALNLSDGYLVTAAKKQLNAFRSGSLSDQFPDSGDLAWYAELYSADNSWKEEYDPESGKTVIAGNIPEGISDLIKNSGVGY